MEAVIRDRSVDLEEKGDCVSTGKLSLSLAEGGSRGGRKGERRLAKISLIVGAEAFNQSVEESGENLPKNTQKIRIRSERGMVR